MDPLLVAYLSFTFVLVVTPGSTTAVVVRNTLMGGRAAGLAAAAGAALGNTSHAAAAGLGLAVVFSRWPAAMTGLRFAGAAYLAWLGAVSVYRVTRHADGGLALAADAPCAPRRSLWTAIRQGLAINLLNPVIATFYLVVVPTFLYAGAPPWYYAVLAAIHVSMAFVCHGAWALGLHTVRRWLRAPRARRTLEGATGIALLSLAGRVLLGA